MLLNFLCRNSGFLFFLRRTFFKNLQGLCIIRSLIFKVLVASHLERQLVYLSTRILPCQQEKGIIFEKNLAYFDSYKILILPYLYLEF